MGVLNWDRTTGWHLNSEDPTFEYLSTNPCFTGDMQLLTEQGYKTFAELEDREVNIININGEGVKGKVWCSGEKETVKLRLSNDHHITCTPDHVFMDIDGNETEARNLKGRKIMPYTGHHKLFDDEYIKYGFMQGDGGLTRLRSSDHAGIEVNIGEDDDDIRFLFRNDDFTEKSYRAIYVRGYKNKLKNLGFDGKVLPERKFPSTYDNWTSLQKSSFLQGCYSANGSVITNHRVGYKTTSRDFADKLVKTLTDDFGITAYITTNKAREVEFDNGTYLCKESYDVNISRYKDLQIFHNEIGFYHRYKKIALRQLLKYRAPSITSIKPNGVHKVYDFNEPKTHWGVVEGYIAHNCAEKPLVKGGSCLLGSLALDKYVINPFAENAYFDFDEFAKDTKVATRYLDEVLEEGIEHLPLQEQIEAAKDYRNLGVGFMGLADAYIKLGLKYGENDAIELLEQIGHKMINAALQESAIMAKELGTYRKYNSKYVLKSPFLLENATDETLALVKEHGLRNAELLSIAPTGSISTLSGIAGGLEPHFMLTFMRKTESLYGEDTYYEVNAQIVQDYLDAKGLSDNAELPDYFVTAMTLDYRKRIRTQAAIQKYIDSSISSTVNVPEEFTVDQVEDLYMYAWEMGLKGVTIFRSNCARMGILTSKEDTKKENDEDVKKDIEPSEPLNEEDPNCST